MSDVGMRRANNQDAYVVALAGSPAHWQERGHLFCVADGMGAHAAGELASKLAVDNIPLNYEKLFQMPPSEAILEAIRETNATIYARGQGSVDFHGMGTTCTSLLVLPYGAVVAHVGDSRVYRLRGATLEQLTFDHSLVWEMAEAGSVSDRDIPNYVPKNVITRSLGPHESVSIDREGPFPVEPGDTFLLCSDGLTGPVPDREIGTILGCLPPDEAAQTLVDLANLRGGPDNITTLVVQVNEKLSAKTAEMEPPVEPTEEDRQPLPRPPIDPLLLAATTVLFFTGLIFAVVQWWTSLAVSCVLLVACVVWMLARRSPSPSRPEARHPSLGRGPYRSYDCRPNDESVASLMGLLAELRIVAIEQGWDIQWEPIDRLTSAANQAREQRDYQTGVTKLATAVRSLMQQIRDQRQPPTDSRLEL